MPQITPFARAALIEFLVLSLFTGQMSKLPPHGTSPAGPARAPGGQRVPPRPGGCRAALPDQAGRGTITYPGRPPGTGPAQPLPRPGAGTRPDGGRKGEPRLRDVGWNRPNPPTRLPPPLRSPSRSAAEAGASLVPRLSCSPRLWPAPGGRSPRNL